MQCYHISLNTVKGLRSRRRSLKVKETHSLQVADTSKNATKSRESKSLQRLKAPALGDCKVPSYSLSCLKVSKSQQQIVAPEILPKIEQNSLSLAPEYWRLRIVSFVWFLEELKTSYFFFGIYVTFRSTCWLFQIVYEGEIWCSFAETKFDFNITNTR